jgi:hypothetical protein
MQLSGSHQKTPGSYQAVVTQSSVVCCAVKKAVIKELSGGCQADNRQLSNSPQVFRLQSGNEPHHLLRLFVTEDLFSLLKFLIKY